VKQVLHKVGLENYEQRIPSQLSGGEKKRLAIAGVLCMNPKIIVFDEPFNCLDFSGVKQVLQQMIKLHEEGKTILIITHDLEKVFAHANRLIILGSGEVLYDKEVLAEELPKELANYPIKIPKCLKSEMSWLK
jgi:biotin transport system ATP-binding protein